ncbi:kinase-like domain-containing protein [Xylariales sp. PMI_506]|nr:kinase-like domain-containing protein [Xylariales sp. PMI_506]
MSSTPDKTWISGYLDSHPIYISATPLDGGVSNFLYRLTKKDGSTVILKHAEPYAACDKTWSYGIERVACEHAALSLIPTALLSSSSADTGEVEIPHVISYDHSEHNLIMSDCGGSSKDLHTAFPSLTSAQRMDYGRRLGLWLAALHKCTGVDTAAFSANIAAKERKGIDQRISLLSAGLPIASSSAGTPAQVASEQREFAELLEPFVVAVTEVETGVMVHGDFWPGNILVSTSPAETTKDSIAVIDWEDVRLGTGASDLGVFAAEAWLLCHFHTTSARAAIVEPEDFGMLDMFLASYLETIGSVEEEFLREAILQFAINLSVGRGGKELMLPVKRFGVEIVKLVVGEKRDWEGVLKLGWGMEGWKSWVRSMKK